MWRVFFTSAIVAVVVRTAMGWCKSGKCGHFGSGGFIIWDVSELRSELSPFLLSVQYQGFVFSIPLLDWFYLQWSGGLLVCRAIANGYYWGYWRSTR